ncbi:hypothetical protein [Hyphococcus luteus]|nr:hypothetical protein [Marinicaulis flavus]
MPAAKTLLTYLAPAAFLAGMAHLAWLAGAHWTSSADDFRLLWLAGDFWTAGGNPYTEEFAQTAAAQFAGIENALWLAGPNWFPIAAIFSLFDPATAGRAWFFFNAAALLGASGLNVATFRKMAAQSTLFGDTEFASLLKSLSPLTLFLLHAGFITTTEAVSGAFVLGAASPLVYFGASLLLYGAAAKHDLAGAGGVALLMLQPSIGLILIAGLGLSAYGRRALILGAIFSFLMAVPVLAVTPGVDIAAALISGAGQTPSGSAEAAAGLRALLSAAGAPDLGAMFYFLLALAAVSTAGLAGRKRARALKPVDNLMIAASAALAVAPLHAPNFVLVGVLLFYAAALRPPLGAGLIAAAFLSWRGGDLPGFGLVDASVYASLGATAMFALLIGAGFFSPAPAPVRRPAPSLGDNVVLWSAFIKKRRNA